MWIFCSCCGLPGAFQSKINGESGGIKNFSKGGFLMQETTLWRKDLLYRSNAYFSFSPFPHQPSAWDILPDLAYNPNLTFCSTPIHNL